MPAAPNQQVYSCLQIKYSMDLWILWTFFAVSLLAKEGCSEFTIGGCEEGRVDVVEDRTYSFTCDSYTSWGPEWTVYGDKGKLLYRGSCQQRSCTPWNDQFSVGEKYQLQYHGSSYYTSSLIIKDIKRDSARLLYCISSLESTMCKLRIIATPVYRDCSVRISNWMVTGSCTLTKMYSSDNNYYCKWRESGNNNEEFGDFQTQPVPYKGWNSREYTTGVCSFAKPTPLIRGLYTYNMRVLPGDVHFQQTINIGEPYQVKLTHSCPEYVFEESSINCSCSASRDVTPPALLVWEGRNDVKLLLTNISRQQDQEQFTCQLKWGPDGSIKENMSYRLTVAWNKQANTPRTNAGVIGGVIAAVLALIIVAGLIVYIIKKRKGILDREWSFLRVFSRARKLFNQRPVTPLAVIKKPQTQIMTQIQTQTSIRRHVSPSGDTASSGHVTDDYAVVYKKSFNNTDDNENNGAHQASLKINGVERQTIVLTPTTKPKSALNTQTKVQDLHGTVYMNVTEVPTDSGLGVYHVVPWATLSGSPEPDTNEYSVPTTSEDEYNELHFEDDRTGQEDQSDTYHHLQIT
ncbi:uncharacterized protein LOC112568578 [Pomacea canaliculata]|uniref:uncharacterized protein LOC112568578 n=1 Tax=Pomacea canaliculata TaxID=400727 RepID=UPI000D7276A2|nr:uncharacterized protein LOC112568578 [Pomacea canaliculata]